MPSLFIPSFNLWFRRVETFVQHCFSHSSLQLRVSCQKARPISTNFNNKQLRTRSKGAVRSIRVRSWVICEPCHQSQKLNIYFECFRLVGWPLTSSRTSTFFRGNGSKFGQNITSQIGHPKAIYFDVMMRSNRTAKNVFLHQITHYFLS